MTTPRRALVAVVVLVLAALVAGCSSAASDTTAEGFVAPLPNPSRTLDTGIGWLIDVFDEPGCMQVRERALATECLSTDVASVAPGLWRFRGEGTQLIVLVLRSDEVVSGDWTSSRQVAETDFVEVSPGLRVGVFPLDGDDDAKDVRLLDAAGELVRVVPLAET